MCSHTDLYDGVHRTSFLAEPTVDALGHVNVISGGSPAAVRTYLGLDGDGLGGERGGRGEGDCDHGMGGDHYTSHYQGAMRILLTSVCEPLYMYYVYDR